MLVPIFRRIHQYILTSRKASMMLVSGILLLALNGMYSPVSAVDDAKSFLGGWDLTLPDGGAGWLGVSEKDGELKAEILWGGGSVMPIDSAKVEKEQLVLIRDAKSNPQTITAKLKGDSLAMTISHAGEDEKKIQRDFTGKRSPALPPAPDLSKVKFGEKIELVGKDLSGWKLTDPNAANGWSVEKGVLINRTEQKKGEPAKHFGNLRTEKEFEDFNLTLDVRVTKDGNSGVYLRGIYEVQVFDSYGGPLDSHNMGAIYSRICPTESAEKPAGEWQTLDITLVDRHVTVILNGKKIIDNQPLAGCTGGALWADQLRPGPIYLQGDHTGVEYRNIVLRPVVGE
jgi:hypothetical protein